MNGMLFLSYEAVAVRRATSGTVMSIILHRGHGRLPTYVCGKHDSRPSGNKLDSIGDASFRPLGVRDRFHGTCHHSRK